jgi:hypothetical protein
MTTSTVSPIRSSTAAPEKPIDVLLEDLRQVRAICDLVLTLTYDKEKLDMLFDDTLGNAMIGAIAHTEAAIEAVERLNAERARRPEEALPS